MPEMTTRSGHSTALLETIGARGATKLHADAAEECSERDRIAIGGAALNTD